MGTLNKKLISREKRYNMGIINIILMTTMTLTRENIASQLREIESMILDQDMPVQVDFYTISAKQATPYIASHAYAHADREVFSSMDDMVADLTTHNTL